MTDEWLSGFFDGEGCVSGQSTFLVGKYIKQPRVSIQISITQKDRNILEQIQQKYGGTIYNKQHGTHCIKWTGKTNIQNILRTLAPHCICKREQILLALRFCETLREENLGCVSLPEEVHKERKEIFDNLKKLKVIS